MDADTSARVWKQLVIRRISGSQSATFIATRDSRSFSEEKYMSSNSARDAKYRRVLVSAAAIAVCAACVTTSVADDGSRAKPEPAAVESVSNAAPIYGITIPPGYRDWKVISINRIEGKLNQLRAQFGNDIAVSAIKDGKLPFPDGSIIAAVHWNYEASGANNEVLALLGSSSFVAGSPVNAQFMVKDSKKYASTGGWGFADFRDGKPQSEDLHRACFACHQPAQAHDYVFAHYAPAS